MRLAKALVIVVAVAAMAAVPSAAQAQTAAVSLPDTPAGTILHAWLDAFNSGDSLRLDAYYRQYEPDWIESPDMSAQRRIGGFDLMTVERTEPRHIEVTVRERSGPQVSSVVLTTPSDGSMKVASQRVFPLGPNASADAARIDGAKRARVIDGAIAMLDRTYVFPEIAKQASDSLRARLQRGAYDPYTTGPGFATLLHDELREITRDQHMSVHYSVPMPPAAGPPPPAPTPEEIQAKKVAFMEANNCGFVKAEVLPGDIGYLKFDSFKWVDVCGPTASAAMNFLAATNALIIDMRDNTGGNADMVAYISSYLFSRRTHLNSLYSRVTGQTKEYWATDEVPGRKFGGEKPVYVLTSDRTFSAAEELSYNLQSLDRAVIVGETTRGGAHPVAPHQIAGQFMIRIPFARAINPITGTNWEGVGVEPDVEVPETEALASALKLLAGRPRP